jgi:transcriptional regulator
MYIPKAFREDRDDRLYELLEAHPFASVITAGGSGLMASHIPMALEREAIGSGRPMGLLTGHLSRANPQWRDLAENGEALAIFSGPQHYITPNWYPEKHETGRVVPTWNYAVVHVYGRVEVVEDAEWLLAHLEGLTNVHEAKSPTPWKITDAPAEYVASQVKGIVGLRMSIERMEGKWKVSQNRAEQDRQGVAKGLGELNTPESKAMKALVEERD